MLPLEAVLLVWSLEAHLLQVLRQVILHLEELFAIVGIEHPRQTVPRHELKSWYWSVANG